MPWVLRRRGRSLGRSAAGNQQVGQQNANRHTSHLRPLRHLHLSRWKPDPRIDYHLAASLPTLQHPSTRSRLMDCWPDSLSWRKSFEQLFHSSIEVLDLLRRTVGQSAISRTTPEQCLRLSVKKVND